MYGFSRCHDLGVIIVMLYWLKFRNSSPHFQRDFVSANKQLDIDRQSKICMNILMLLCIGVDADMDHFAKSKQHWLRNTLPVLFFNNLEQTTIYRALRTFKENCLCGTPHKNNVNIHSLS